MRRATELSVSVLGATSTLGATMQKSAQFFSQRLRLSPWQREGFSCLESLTGR